MIKNLPKLVDLVQQNTYLDRLHIVRHLIDEEDKIRTVQVYNNFENFDKEYFLLAAGKTINTYRRGKI